MKPYRVNLKVSQPTGQRVTAIIRQINGEYNIIEIAPLEAVRIDNPDFASNGIIKFRYLRVNHKATITKVTKYLEDLFLKELSGEDNNSKPEVNNNPGGNEEKSDTGSTSKSEGSKSSGLHRSRRRGKQTESNRGGEQGSDVAEGSNPGDSTGDQTRD